MAPEIMNENGYDAFYPDFWSMGVLLFTLLFGTVPFKAQCMEELHALIQKGEFEVPAGVSQDAQDLIKSLIVVNPKKRITIPEILSHPWFKEICEEDSESAEDDEQKESIQQKIENEIEAQK
jgi:serine/threonine protein kinase